MKNAFPLHGTKRGGTSSQGVKPNDTLRKRIYKLVLILLLLVAWEAGVRLSGVSPLLFPPASEVFRTLFTDLLHGKLPGHIGFSLLLIFEGLLIGGSAALLLSLAGTARLSVSSWVETLVALFHPLPGIALLPVVILWAGTGRIAVLLIIIHSVLWPLTTNLTAGIRAVPQHLHDVSRNFQLNLLQRTMHLIIPSILPYLISGMRIGWARAWRALIAAEMVFGAVSGRGGLGWYIFQKRVFMETEGLFAGILLLMLIGIFFEEFVFELLEKATIRKWGVSK